MASQTDIHGSVVVPNRAMARRIVRVSLWLFEHWIVVFAVVYGTFVFLPFLAPVFMRLGWDALAWVIYTIYGTLCH